MRTRALVALIVCAAGAAASAAPRGQYVRVPASGAARLAAAPSSTIIYLKRCPASGCVVHFGAVDDSRTQTSSISDGDRTIGAFTQGDAVWNQLVDCVKTTYSPFGVTVTDVDPGASVPHYENIVGGSPDDLRSDISNAGGVAPFTCDEIPNGISYTFDVYGPDVGELCWTAAQETAHVFGLDHEHLSQDPMTYLPGDIPKRFQDVDADCGEFTARGCMCPGATQNSYRKILALFGPGAPITPGVMITAPGDGKTVQPGFTLRATATSIVRIDHMELYVDGTLAGNAATAPYSFQPMNIDLGDHQLEARAYDVQGTPGSAMIGITMDPPCTRDKGCTDADVCVEGLCIAGPSVSGGLGATCTTDAQCLTGQCADGGDPSKKCVAACDLGDAKSCPRGFSCEMAGAGGVCYPSQDAGCCDAGGGSPTGALVVAMFAGVIVLRRRR